MIVAREGQEWKMGCGVLTEIMKRGGSFVRTVAYLVPKEG